MTELLKMDDDLPTDQKLDRLQRTTVLYYLHETNPDNGLVRDKTDPAAQSSIAAVGLALASLPVVVERGVLYRPFAAKMARRVFNICVFNICTISPRERSGRSRQSTAQIYADNEELSFPIVPVLILAGPASHHRGAGNTAGRRLRTT
jgi:hypothetical protein